MSSCMGVVVERCSNEEDLFTAIQKNDFRSATTLVTQSDVDLNQVDSFHKTMLSRAVELGHVPMVQMLLNHGANINTPSFSGQCFSFETPIMTAARLQNEQLVDLLLTYGCKLNSIQGKEGKTALQWLASYGDLKMINLLYSAGSDINFQGPCKHTALHYATIANQEEVVIWLLEQRAHITPNSEGRTALHIACAKSYINIAKHLFLAKPNLNELDSFGFTPFSLSCLQGCLEIVKFMMENHQLESGSFDLNDGLLRASECGHLEVLEYLIAQGASVNAFNTKRETALSIAAKGQPNSVQLLLENNALINVVDRRGYTPLQHAILREQASIAAMLIKHGSYLRTCSPTIDSPLRSSYNISNPVLIKYLILAGYNLAEDKWFSVDAIKTKLRELDFQFQYKSLHYHIKSETWQWIIEQFGRPRKLAELSRTAIRKQMVVASGNRSICANVTSLPLPSAIKTFILMDNFWQ